MSIQRRLSLLVIGDLIIKVGLGCSPRTALMRYAIIIGQCPIFHLRVHSKRLIVFRYYCSIIFLLCFTGFSDVIQTVQNGSSVFPTFCSGLSGSTCSISGSIDLDDALTSMPCTPIDKAIQVCLSFHLTVGI